MGAGKIGYGATKIAVVENIYITCSKIFVISLIVYVIAVTIQNYGETDDES